MKKVYYQLEMYQKSPLRIGNGEDEVTDSDLMTDKRGCPFIPGSSVAGVLRDLCSERISTLSDEKVKEMFGEIDEKNILASRVLVSDAAGGKSALAAEYMITARDAVRLDEWGISASTSKYDFQVVETKLPYYSVIEWGGEEEDYQEEIAEGLDKLMQLLAKDGISFGARTSRGYGKMSVAVKKKTYDFPGQLKEWLDFDPLDENAFADGETVTGDSFEYKMIKIQAEVQMKGSFSVRVNTARGEMLDDGSVPDSLPLCNIEKKPVIPGTSWAGVFRHHMLGILRQAGIENCEGETNLLFGMQEGESHIRSAIGFGETVVEGGNPYSITRNAVDRFTQAPRNTALFTDQLWQGGKGGLEITVEKDRLNKFMTQLLAVSLIDLDLGLLTFGGTAGTGHGRCEISCITVNGKDVTERLKGQDSHFLEEVL